MKKIALIVGLIVLAGCNTTPIENMSYADQQKLAKQITERCRLAGAKAGTQAGDQCFVQEARAEQYRRGQNKAMVDQYIQAQLRGGHSRVTCQSMGGYGMVTTNCY